MKKSKITIYSTTTCGFCRMLKSYLKSKDIDFEEKLADEDQNLARELYEKSGQLGVPFTIIEQENGDTVNILGFDRPQFDKVLGLN
ncbi:MAG TPA: glutaredoxin family protein [Candidatus Saccharibacteria bacterium]|jgi:glutaredoxin 3|nr:glutaredoxin family protein [Candidatus Saccharibacteria bacterium]HMT56020.1 glutaredoxin family protein [Candidatus Saccharibacteria bacterium]